MSTPNTLKVVLLAGGVGGAKMADGLAQAMPPQNLTIIVNTGDDFQHLGLTICPDLDTITYTLAGIANTETGWGRADETWRTLTEVEKLAGPSWFRLGDLDLATHLTRTHLLNEGHSLTAVTQTICQQLAIKPTILPMSNTPAPTQIHSHGQIYPFQTWFVQERWQPPVTKVQLPDDVRASRAVIQALEKADLVIFAPSNPFVSIDPILNTYPIKAMIMDTPQAVVAITPIIGNQAIKGPAAKMMAEQGLPVTALAVANYYGDLIDGFIFDIQDENEIAAPERNHTFLNSWMKTPNQRLRFAQEVLTFAEQLRQKLSH